MLALSFQENMGDFVFCQIQKLTWHDSFVRLYPPVLCINIYISLLKIEKSQRLITGLIIYKAQKKFRRAKS